MTANLSTPSSDYHKDYGQILKSSTLTGGAQVINIAFGIIRTKVLALLVGPAGVGLIGLYSTVTGTMTALAGLGLSNSGVRQIADTVGSGDTQRVAGTIVTLRRLSVVLGVVGMLLLLILSKPVSRLTFGDSSNWPHIAVLSLSVLFAVVSAGQMALMQGLREIKKLVGINIIGPILCTLVGLPIIYIYAEFGITSYLICLSAMTLLSSWWYARKVIVSDSALSVRVLWKEARRMLSLGMVFMSTGLMASATLYLIRVIVVQKIGLDAAGFYQASCTLSNLYIGFILNAMGMDFYPRLTGAIRDNERCNRMINGQIEVGLLLAAPGIVATMVFAPMVISLLYSPEFANAYEVLKWQVLGTFLRIVSWPLGFLILAKGLGRLYFIVENGANLLHLAMVWIGIAYFDIAGAGIAFFGVYICYTGITIFAARMISEFKWSPLNLQLLALAVPVLSAAYFLPQMVKSPQSFYWGGVMTVAIALASFTKLRKLTVKIG